ncbi:type II toxin-antitoxin system Phd/YefM family antitoxin [Shigella flexneri]|nr:type II toxin-antitoxin system Phd/YefM family antitoxin [Shigella flexneri]
MSYQILTTTAASITDLKKNPMGTVAEGEGDAVAILNRNEPAFYCVPPKLYAYYRELAEDAEFLPFLQCSAVKSQFIGHPG